MLAACHAQGWPTETYRHPDHPLQRHVLEAVRAGTGQRDLPIGVDGCGVPVHGPTLVGMASIYARLGDPERWRGVGFDATVQRAVSAMRARPYLVAGRNRIDTALMDLVPDLVVKGGAEGLICAALLDRGVGVAVKVADGGSRAAGPAMVRALEALEVVREDHRAALVDLRQPPVLGGGRPVGEMVAAFELARP
jgi:L-asparaginase II